MSQLQIILPDRVKTYMKQQMASRGYGDAGEYVAALIESEQRRAVRQELERKLLEAVDEPSTPMTRTEWEGIRQQGRQILAERGRQ